MGGSHVVKSKTKPEDFRGAAPKRRMSIACQAELQHARQLAASMMGMDLAGVNDAPSKPKVMPPQGRRRSSADTQKKLK